MKQLAKTVLAASFCALAVVPAHAGHRHGSGVWDRLERQHARIEQGVESGELSRKEAKTLRKQHRKLHRLAREFREDGVLSRKERRILDRKLDKASDLIWTLKHNETYHHAQAKSRAWRGAGWSWDDESTYWRSEPETWLYFGLRDW
jgi:hypothetical protein